MSYLPAIREASFHNHSYLDWSKAYKLIRAFVIKCSVLFPKNVFISVYLNCFYSNFYGRQLFFFSADSSVMRERSGCAANTLLRFPSETELASVVQAVTLAPLFFISSSFLFRPPFLTFIPYILHRQRRAASLVNLTKLTFLSPFFGFLLPFRLCV